MNNGISPKSLSNRIQRISYSQTLEMSRKSMELRKQGIDIINLSIGEPDFQTPVHVKEAAKKAIDNNFSFYAPVAGFQDLREAISKKLKYQNRLNFAPEQIVVSNGAKQALANVVLTLVDQDCEVLIPAPYWNTYAELDNLAHGTNVFLPTTIENNYKVTAQQVEAAITPKTKVFLFSSPSNPAGSVYSKAELKALAEVFARHENIFIISDEIYEHINFVGQHESIAQFEELKNRVIIINGVSKGYAMTGWRVGYIAAPLWIANNCEKLQGQYTSGVCSIAQKAALAAISGDDLYTLGMNELFRRRRDMVMELISDIPGMICNVPDGAFYVFPNVTAFFGKRYENFEINNDQDFSLFLLSKAHVATVPGSAFGIEECIRISYATSNEKIDVAFERIKNAVALLK